MWEVMAKVKNSILGEIRGNLGPLTFSGNQYGTHVFLGNTGERHATPGQIAHRTIFGSNPFPYSTLSSEVKANWKSFATTVFNNPRKTSKGKNTAYGCFSSCIKTLQGIQSSFVPFQVIYDSFGGVNYTSCVFPGYPTDAPVHQITPFLLGTGAVLVPFSFAYCVLNTLGDSLFHFDMTNTIADPWNSNIFEDPNKQQMGIAIYASKRMKVQTQAPGNLYKTLLFWSGFFVPPTGSLDTSRYLEFNIDLIQVLKTKLHFYKGSDYFAITPLLIDIYGNACKLETFSAILVEP